MQNGSIAEGIIQALAILTVPLTFAVVYLATKLHQLRIQKSRRPEFQPW